jgi:hypothetical protein
MRSPVGGSGVSGAHTISAVIVDVGARIVCTFIDEPRPLDSGGAPDPRRHADVEDADEQLPSETERRHVLDPLLPSAGDPIHNDFQGFPGEVAGLRPTGLATTGEVQGHQLGAFNGVRQDTAVPFVSGTELIISGFRKVGQVRDDCHGPQCGGVRTKDLASGLPTSTLPRPRGTVSSLGIESWTRT